MRAKRGSIILSRELLNEYIDARGLDQITVNDKVWWRHHCGTEWEARVKDRRQGYGCPTCGGSQKGAFRKHPAPYVPDDATNKTKINPPCSAGCGKEYAVSIDQWLRGKRRHRECTGLGKRDDYQLPPGTVCLDPEQYVKVGAKSKLSFKCARGHIFLSRKIVQHKAALAGNTGCPHCAQNYPLASRLADYRSESLRRFKHLSVDDWITTFCACVRARLRVLYAAVPHSRSMETVRCPEV